MASSSFLTEASLAQELSFKDQLFELHKTNKLKILTGYSGGIYLFDIKEKREKPLLEKDGLEYTVHEMTFFPNGQRIAYILSKNSLGPTVQNVLKKGNLKEGQLTVQDPNPLGNGHWIKAIDLNKGTEEELINFPDISGLSISPDGDSIVFAAGTEIHKNLQSRSLYVFNLQSKKLTKIVNENVSWPISNSAWSPNGKKIIYETNSEDVMIYDFDTASSNLLLSGKDGSASYISWTPNSERVVYMTYSDPKRNYYSIKLDGSDKKLFLDNSKWEVGIFLFRHIGRIESPVYFSPDGNYILFGRVRGEMVGQQAYIMDLKTKQIVNLGESHNVMGWYFSGTN